MRREAVWMPVLTGAALGVAVYGLGVKVVALLLALVGALVLFTVPTSPYLAIVAVTPVNVGFGGVLTVTRLVRVGVLAAILFQALTNRSPWPRLWNGMPALLGVGFFASLVFVNLLQGPQDRLGPYFIYAVIFFSTLAYARRPGDPKPVLLTIVVVAVFEVALVMLEVLLNYVSFGGWHEQFATERGDELVRAVGTHAHPITLAGFFLAAMPAAVTLAYLSRPVGSRRYLPCWQRPSPSAGGLPTRAVP